eukprot:4009011-Amphidinium_carterae.1
MLCCDIGSELEGGEGLEYPTMGDALPDVSLPSYLTVSSVAVGTNHTCVGINNTGLVSVKCFGDNSYGQLGYELPFSSSVNFALRKTAMFRCAPARACRASPPFAHCQAVLYVAPCVGILQAKLSRLKEQSMNVFYPYP